MRGPWSCAPGATVAASSCRPLQDEGSWKGVVNAGESVRSVAQVRAVASIVTLVREQFPAAKTNLRPWRDDAQTRQWDEPESLDLSFHFPGWSPRLQCRSLLLQLRFQNNESDEVLKAAWRFGPRDDVRRRALAVGHCRGLVFRGFPFTSSGAGRTAASNVSRSVPFVRSKGSSAREGVTLRNARD